MKISGQDRNALSMRGLIAWAWQETRPVHKNKTNLMIHLVAVPVFVIGHVIVIIGVATLSALFVGFGLALIVMSLISQKYGHSLEANQVHAFAGAFDFIRRLYAEQFCNFWRFLFSGQWYVSYKQKS